MRGAAELWRRGVRWIREHPLAADTLLAVALMALALVIHLSATQLDADQPDRDPTWWTPLFVIASTLPVMFRRRWPIATLMVVLVAQAASELLDISGSTWLAVLVAVYSVGAHTEGRRRVIGVAGVSVVFVMLLVAGIVDDELTVVDAIATAGVLTAALVVGDNVRRRRLHLESLADRAERAERERDLLARERVAEERNRIARELHDIVAHSVSVMVIQASAARRNLDSRPETAPALLENIERTGRQTMDELRQVLGVLRSDVDERLAMPLPTLADLDALVDTHAGLPVRLAVTGIVDSVPAGVSLAAYRVVQEALTNANRHAGPGASVDVRVTCGPTNVEVRVEDDGRGASAQTTADGYGLIGMHERVVAAGGTFAAGPRPGGGWRVSAVLPMPPAAAPATAADAPAAELAS